jgi:MtN3 and saliva related transmembrane protein
VSSTVVGYVAAVLGVTAFVPQAWRVVKTRDTRSLSTPMWIVECLAFAAWVAYGVLLGEWPIILPNSICFLLSAFILTMKVAPRPVRERIADTLDPAPR